MDESTKKCPYCGNPNVVPIRTMDKKHCSDCNRDFPWTLTKGQKTLK